VIVYAAGRESLFLRSYFRSAKDPKNFVNFAPPGVEISFATGKIWYPLKLSHFTDEGTSYIVLDILRRKAPEGKQLHKALKARTEFQVGKTAKVEHQGQTFYATRITGKVQAKKMAQDLELQP
jgi:hypothetical protein